MKKLLMPVCCAALLAAATAEAKTLVAYFSVPETTAAPVNREEENSVVTVGGQVLGNTQYVAQLIAREKHGDLFRIEPQVPYTTDHAELVAQARAEQRRRARPDLKRRVGDLSRYDTVFIGYPIWWSDLPMIVYSFLEQHDLKGKTVIPFVTHGGSHLAGTPATIAKLLPGSRVVADALCLDRDDVEQTATAEVAGWLKALDLK